MFVKERQKGTEESAGYDLYAAEAKTIMPGKNNLVSLDFRWAIPKGFCGRIVPRSSFIKENNVTVEAGQLPLCVCDSRSLCVCVYALPRIGFFRLHDICDIGETFGSTIFCCEHFLGASAKFLHLHLRIYLISPPMKKTPVDRLLERKRYDIMFEIRRKDDIY